MVEKTISDKPNSRLQKYRLTILGEQLETSVLQHYFFLLPT